MSGDGMSSFVSAINTGLSMDAIWGAITPIAPLIIGLTLIAVTRYVVNKNLRGAKNGKSGRA